MEGISIEVPNVDIIPVVKVDIKSVNLAGCVESMSIDQIILCQRDARAVVERVEDGSLSAISVALVSSQTGAGCLIKLEFGSFASQEQIAFLLGLHAGDFKESTT